MGIFCMAQETQTGVLYQTGGVGWGGRWEGGSKGKGYLYTYGWFMLRFDRKQQNSVKLLLFNKNELFIKEIKQCDSKLWQTIGSWNRTPGDPDNGVVRKRY